MDNRHRNLQLIESTVARCDSKAWNGIHTSGWSRWLQWEVMGIKPTSDLKTTWMLSRRRICLDNTDNHDCVIEEQQNGHYESVYDNQYYRLKELGHPICAYEKHFENEYIKITP